MAISHGRAVEARRPTARTEKLLTLKFLTGRHGARETERGRERERERENVLSLLPPTAALNRCLRAMAERPPILFMTSRYNVKFVFKKDSLLEVANHKIKTFLYVFPPLIYIARC